MDVQTLTFIFVGVTFALYIGIAIWSRAGNTDDFYVAGGGSPPLPMGWQQPLIGCLLLHLSRWQVSYLLLDVMGQFT